MKKYVVGPFGGIQPKDEGEGEQRIIRGKSLQAGVKVNYLSAHSPMARTRSSGDTEK